MRRASGDALVQTELGLLTGPAANLSCCVVHDSQSGGCPRCPAIARTVDLADERPLFDALHAFVAGGLILHGIVDTPVGAPDRHFELARTVDGDLLPVRVLCLSWLDLHGEHTPFPSRGRRGREHRRWGQERPILAFDERLERGLVGVSDVAKAPAACHRAAGEEDEKERERRHRFTEAAATRASRRSWSRSNSSRSQRRFSHWTR